MYSIPPSSLWASTEPVARRLPVVEGRLRAGFPSPADDFAIKRQDLNDLLITHPLATFYWQVSGQSMVDAGIGDGDLLVVNRAITPVHKHIVVAQVDGDFTVKHLYKRSGRVKLTTANPTFPEITFKEGQQLIICGVVTAAIKRFVK
ncbi:MAG: translesion error-prone DNA polymerase V autoproteolytic subunit [Hyphomicrobiales bacterium]|nr:MAG: translesion error-prone DNA polymerase V autoproteolytic subunit [Hyphomicrobiales bacterium]